MYNDSYFSGNCIPLQKQEEANAALSYQHSTLSGTWDTCDCGVTTTQKLDANNIPNNNYTALFKCTTILPFVQRSEER